MEFDSYSFIIFLTVVLLLHCLPLPWAAKKLHLVLASYLFYAVWNPPFVLLLWLSTIVDWVAAQHIAAVKNTRYRRYWLFFSLAANLGVLGFFKYGTFLLESFIALAAVVGVDYHPPTSSIVLPVGISFYTFQSLSYTIDVYTRKLKPASSFLDFALYVTFFPQLVAGPIVRAGDFLPQCVFPQRATLEQLGWGLSLLVIGLFQKVFVADTVFAPIADSVFGVVSPLDWKSSWCGTLAFAGQIFCDFSGYSTCAIGIALCFGFQLPDNFRSPYAALGFSDFWKRWHISLSTWLRDYLYIPLGGNRCGPLTSARNLMITMLLGGLWHGASWKFVVWGAIHGLLLLVERLLRAVFPIDANAAVRAGGYVGTFLAICFTWVFFRARSVAHALAVAAAMLGLNTDGTTVLSTVEMVEAASCISILLLAHWLMRDTHLEHLTSYTPWWLRSLVLAVMLLAILMSPGGDRAFIYFQF